MDTKLGVHYKKEKVLVFAVVIILAVGAVVLSFVLGQQNVSPLVLEPVKPIEPKMNWDLLSDSRLEKLQPLREISELEGEPGRVNPFLPIGQEGVEESSEEQTE
jgi:hypothetical protein